MTGDSAALVAIVLVGIEVLIGVTAVVEWCQRRERARLAASHHCRPGCRCRGAIEGRRAR